MTTKPAKQPFDLSYDVPVLPSELYPAVARLLQESRGITGDVVKLKNAGTRGVFIATVKPKVKANQPDK